MKTETSHGYLEKIQSTLISLVEYFSTKLNRKIEENDIGHAILDIYDLQEDTEVWDLLFEKGDLLKEILDDYPLISTIGKIELSFEDSIDLEGSYEPLNEKELKTKNQIWIINKNDPDPFPSNPHAHHSQSGLKLDLSNGNLYKKHKLIKNISKKQLKKIRKLCESSDISLPELTI